MLEHFLSVSQSFLSSSVESFQFWSVTYIFIGLFFDIITTNLAFLLLPCYNIVRKQSKSQRKTIFVARNNSLHCFSTIDTNQEKYNNKNMLL